MLKHYIIILFWQFTKKLNHFFYLFKANEFLDIFVPVLLGLLNESKQFWNNALIIDFLSRIQNIVFFEKY